MTTAAATAYVLSCRTSGDPIRLAEVERLSGLSDGSLHRFVVSALADLPTPPRSTGRAKTTTTDMERWMLLGAQIYEASEVERAARNAVNCKAYRNRKILSEIGRERTAA